METVTLGSMLNKYQRFFIGSFVLLLVDVIWVSSSELTKFIYNTESFEKPFFCTYVKTSMFTLYLLGYLVWPHWKDTCASAAHTSAGYAHVDPDQEDENYYAEANNSGGGGNGNSGGGNNHLSNPVYVPVKTADRDVDRSNTSGTESDDSSIRSVRFNKMAEVRHLSEAEATEALLARLSYQASLRAGEIAKRTATKLPIVRIARVAFVFCFLWFLANYSYQLALAHSEAGIVNVLSSTSSLFTLVLAAIFPSNQGDKFTISKLVAVLLSIIGIGLVSFSDMKLESRTPIGPIMSLLSALFYAAYLVFLRRRVDHEDKMNIPVFFGFVGLFNLLLLWPLFFVFHISEVEVFELPSKQQLLYLLLNGLLGTVISEALWLWGCFLTSSLTATIAISLTIPMTMSADVLFKKVAYPYLFYVGAVHTTLSFITVTVFSLYDNWDPVLDLLRCAYAMIVCRRNRFVQFAEVPSEQTEALIGISSNCEHEA